MRLAFLLVCLFLCGCETVNVNLSVELPSDQRARHRGHHAKPTR